MIKKTKLLLCLIFPILLYSCEKAADPSGGDILINELLPINTTIAADQNRKYHVLEIDNLRVLQYSTTYFATCDYLFYYQHVRGEFDKYKISRIEIGEVDFLKDVCHITIFFEISDRTDNISHKVGHKIDYDDD